MEMKTGTFKDYKLIENEYNKIKEKYLSLLKSTEFDANTFYYMLSRTAGDTVSGNAYEFVGRAIGSNSMTIDKIFEKFAEIQAKERPEYYSQFNRAIKKFKSKPLLQHLWIGNLQNTVRGKVLEFDSKNNRFKIEVDKVVNTDAKPDINIPKDTKIGDIGWVQRKYVKKGSDWFVNDVSFTKIL